MRRVLALVIAGSVVVSSVSAATADSTPFVDVEPESWYADAVAWMVTENLTTGTSPTTFSPHEPVTRGQFATVLWRWFDRPAGEDHPFTDVVAGSFYATAVAWLAAVEITTGSSATTFSPDDPVTRGQFAAFITRAFGVDAFGTTTAALEFDDVDAGRYFFGPVGWLVEEGLTMGLTPGRFGPDEPLTRAQLAVFLQRMSTRSVAALATHVEMFALDGRVDDLAVSEDRAVVAGRLGGVGATGSVAVHDLEGAQLWTASLGDSVEGAPRLVAVGEEGGVYVAWVADDEPATTIVRRYDALGVLDWEHELVGSVSDLAPWPGGGVLAAGSTTIALAGDHGGGTDVFGRSYDASGVVVWETQFGGPGDDVAAAVAAAADGSVALAGRSESMLDEHVPVLTDPFVRTFDAEGEEAGTWQPPALDGFEFPTWGGVEDLDADPEGGWVALYGYLDTGYENWRFVSIDARGEELSRRRISSGFVSTRGIVVTPERLVIAGGSREISAPEDLWPAWLGSWAFDGELLWHSFGRRLLGPGVGGAVTDLASTPDGAVWMVIALSDRSSIRRIPPPTSS